MAARPPAPSRADRVNCAAEDIDRSARFSNRREAGTQLGERLREFLLSSPSFDDMVVLGLPRGGVPVAAEVSRTLRKPFSILSVRKIGAPSNPELAIGAIAADGTRLYGSLKNKDVSSGYIKLETQEQLEVAQRREEVLLANLDLPRVRDIRGHVACITDDGIATGLTAAVAAESARRHGARAVVIASPVVAADTADRLLKYADAVVSVCSPEDFLAVAQWYGDFSPTTDEEARRVLEEASGWPWARLARLEESEGAPGREFGGGG
eukprot:tig00021435_g21422.t1